MIVSFYYFSFFSTHFKVTNECRVNEASDEKYRLTSDAVFYVTVARREQA